jgi:tetratricopeptide (TPR) repeat protein
MTMDMFIEKRASKLLEKGRAAVQVGDYVTALHEFKAAAYVSRTPSALTNWGTMEHCLGDTNRAIELCREAIGLDPECGSAYNDIGFYLVALGRADDAIVWFKKAIATKRSGASSEPGPIPWINLGKLYLERKDYGEALQHFEEALKVDPDNSEARDLARSIRNRIQ